MGYELAQKMQIGDVMENLIADIAHRVGYEIRQLRDTDVKASSWLDGYHKGKKAVTRRTLRELLALCPQYRQIARDAFNGSYRFDLAKI